MRGETEREIHATKELIAIKEAQRGFGMTPPVHQVQLEVCVPKEFQHMLNWDKKQLEKHLERLERRHQPKEEFDDLSEMR